MASFTPSLIHLTNCIQQIQIPHEAMIVSYLTGRFSAGDGNLQTKSDILKGLLLTMP